VNLLQTFPHQDPIAKAVYVGVIACWFIFAGVFLARRRPPRHEETRRDRLSMLGIFFQALAYAAVWTLRRQLFAPIVSMPVVVEIGVGMATIGIAAGSIWLVMSAVRTLGKQWALAARLVEGHQLITGGPYRWVRNPIYTGMFGMMIATGLAISHWIAFPPALVLFAIGTVIRVRSEEKLLRKAFGQEFEDYAHRVPAVLPGIY